MSLLVPLAGLSRRLEQRPCTAFVLALVAVPAIGVLDYLSGAELSFSLFYLIPVALAAWHAGAVPTGLAVLLSAVTWLAADLAAGHVYSQSWIPLWNSLVRLAIFGLTAFLLRALKQALLAEQQLADRDPLTGLWNRRAFTEQLEQELDRARRYRERFSIAYFDLDHFKQVNDGLGHDTGDELLRTVAATLQAQVRATDVAARLGGDEFAVLFPVADYAQAGQGLAKLRERLLEAMQARGWPVTFSIGALSYSAPPASSRDCIGAVDQLMYRVKKGSKNDLLHERR